MRASLAPGRWDLIRQFLTENVVLSICGGLLGIFDRLRADERYQLMMPPFSLRARSRRSRWTGASCCLRRSSPIVTGLLFGMAPALQATKPDLAASMKEESRGSSGSVSTAAPARFVDRRGGCAGVRLLVVSGLMMRSFFGLLNVDTGFDSTNVLTMRLPIAIEQFPDPEQLNRYLREVRTAVEAVPGVRETAYSCAAADAGHLLRDADAGGQPPAGRPRKPGRRILQGGQPVVLHYARHQATQGTAACPIATPATRHPCWS